VAAWYELRKHLTSPAFWNNIFRNRGSAFYFPWLNIERSVDFDILTPVYAQTDHQLVSAYPW
jgi:hypothetical protein